MNNLIDKILGILGLTRMPQRMTEETLTQESLNAAAYYLETKMSGAPLDHQQLVVNAIATGFYMGVRHLEEEMRTPK